MNYRQGTKPIMVWENTTRQPGHKVWRRKRGRAATGKGEKKNSHVQADYLREQTRENSHGKAYKGRNLDPVDNR